MYNKYEKIRDAKGMTDFEVSKRANIPQSSIYDWKQRSAKNPDAGISVSAIAKIAAVLDAKIDDFL